MQTDWAAGATPSPFLRLEVLKKRAEFLQAARGKRRVAPGFVLQAWNRKDNCAPRIGYTCSKKVGNAVARNRAKRRLREIARKALPECGKQGWDYVLIGRKEITATLPFETLVSDLEEALSKLHMASK